MSESCENVRVFVYYGHLHGTLIEGNSIKRSPNELPPPPRNTRGRANPTPLGLDIMIY